MGTLILIAIAVIVGMIAYHAFTEMNDPSLSEIRIGFGWVAVLIVIGIMAVVFSGGGSHRYPEGYTQYDRY